jgi:APA family basic amino acid/polyamine antiporter
VLRGIRVHGDRSRAPAYTYGYATLGEFFAWVIGWDLILEYALARPPVAVGGPATSGQLRARLPRRGIPAAWSTAPCTWWPAAGLNPEAIINLPAVLITLASRC